MKIGSATIGTHIVVVVAIGFALIAYLFWVSPDSAAAHLPLILAAIGGALAILQKQDTIETTAQKSVAVSEKNSVSLAQVDAKVDGVHAIVNSRDTALREEMTTLRDQVEDLRGQLAAAKASDDRRRAR